MGKTGSQSQFAREYGYSRAAVTQFKNAGRLVFMEPGILDFEASKKRIFDTSNPSRKDVTDRHSKERGINTENDNEQSQDTGNHYHNAKTVREKYLALQAKLDYEQNSGLLIEKSQIEKIIFERARQFRDGLMTCKRRVSPELANANVNDIETILDREFRSLLESFSKLPVIE